MNKCPFIAARQVAREARLDADGKPLEQQEAPAAELRECLGAECQVFDAAAGTCSVPAIEAQIKRLEELQRAAQEDASRALLAEVRETRENTAATMIHVLRKIDAANELLGRHQAPAGGGGGDVTALLAPLNEMKENLANSQTKFTDILELMLEDQQKRAQEAHTAAAGGAVPGGPVSVDLAPLQASLGEMKEALAASNAKFTDILELMLEEQQKRAQESHAVAAGGALPGGPVSVDLAPLQASLGEMKEALATSNAKFTDILELMLEEQQKRAAAVGSGAGGAGQTGPVSVDLAPLQASLGEMKESLNTSNAKFTDILELMLEDQQKRAAQQAAPAPETRIDLAPLQASLGEMKEALAASNTKFTDILELMLEEQQRKAAEGAAVAAALDKLAQKQEQLFGSLAQQLQPAGGQDWQRELKGELTGMAGMIEQGIARITEAEAKRQTAMETSAGRLAELQQSMLALLESQRAELGAAGAERTRREAEEHNEKGVMLYHRRELAAAEAEFRRALELRPDFAEAFNNIGLAMSDQGKREDAVTAFRRAVELMPDAPETYNNLGCLFKSKRDYQQAVEHFNQAIAKRADYAPGYFNLGLAYEEMEKFDQAIKAWEKVLTLQPTHDEARRKIATYRARKA
ncbi:MAG: tetratricopeptide repeat protein [Candidatus Edwardsbacteria bacterium]|nr:tetratricopeptide repeat protein [Candidatus Edwardsbacteria bacterium]